MLTVLEARSLSSLGTDSVSGGDYPSSWLAKGHLPAVSSHGLSSVQMQRGGESSGVSLIIRTSILLHGGPTLMTSSNPDYFLMAPSSNIITMGVRASPYEVLFVILLMVASSNTGIILHFR